MTDSTTAALHLLCQAQIDVRNAGRDNHTIAVRRVSAGVLTFLTHAMRHVKATADLASVR